MFTKYIYKCLINVLGPSGTILRENTLPHASLFYYILVLTFSYDAVYTVHHFLYGYDTTSILLTSSLADHFQDKGKNFPLACLWLVLLMCPLSEGYAGYTHFPHLTVPDKIEANVIVTSMARKITAITHSRSWQGILFNATDPNFKGEKRTG